MTYIGQGIHRCLATVLIQFAHIPSKEQPRLRSQTESRYVQTELNAQGGVMRL